MIKESVPPKFIAAGYLILQRAEDARRASDYRRGFGPYYGVDRVPPFVAADPTVRAAIGVPPIEDPEMCSLVDDWFDAGFGDTAFIPTRDRALYLLRGFQSHGYDIELVYCQLAWSAGDEDRLAAYPVTAEPVPDIMLTYGFDVSWPTCKHSAILQPGVVPSTPSWRHKLNAYGLLDDYDDAVKLRAEYLAVYPYPPFDAYAVHKLAEKKREALTN